MQNFLWLVLCLPGRLSNTRSNSFSLYHNCHGPFYIRYPIFSWCLMKRSSLSQQIQIVTSQQDRTTPGLKVANHRRENLKHHIHSNCLIHKNLTHRLNAFETHRMAKISIDCEDSKIPAVLCMLANNSAIKSEWLSILNLFAAIVWILVYGACVD